MTAEPIRTIFTATLVRRVAQQTGLSQHVVRQVLGSSLQTIAAALAAGERVTLPGFGTFYTSSRQAGRVRSVRDGRPVAIPARRVAAFRVGEVLKRAVARKRPGRRRLFGLAR
jgi:DNA-binding protein HU-beta